MTSTGLTNRRRVLIAGCLGLAALGCGGGSNSGSGSSSGSKTSGSKTASSAGSSSGAASAKNDAGSPGASSGGSNSGSAGGGSAGSSSASNPASAQQNVGPSGGMVKLDDGLKATIPAAALPSDTAIEISVSSASAPADLGEPTVLSKIYEFLPDGQKFDKPIEVQMPYDGGDSVVLAFSESTDGTVEDLDVSAADGKVATVAMAHFCKGFVAQCNTDKQMCFSHMGQQGERKPLCTKPVTWQDIRLCKDGEGCKAGHCVCKTPCGNKTCGQDACGNSCGTCTGTDTCSADGQCVACVPQCATDSCGDDGCGGTCSCTGGKTCNAEKACVTPAPTCAPACPTGSTCTATDTCTCTATQAAPCNGVCCPAQTTCSNNQCTQVGSCQAPNVMCGSVCCPQSGCNDLGTGCLSGA